MLRAALTAEQWAAVELIGGPRHWDDAVGGAPELCAYLVALNNAALPDTDPRKLTWAMVGALGIAQNEARMAVRASCSCQPSCDDCTAAAEAFCTRLQAIADALAAYLPPRTT